MAFSSNLFAGDQKLEACQVDDAAHLTLDARGDHVAKVQMALFAIDWLKIDPAELRSRTYGRSTAKAVLAFKTKRRIINRAYETRPDDIVGKMTIARLDQEMTQWEQTQRGHGDCSGAPSGPAPRADSRSASLAFALPVANSSVRDAPGKPQLHKALHIYCSITRKASIDDGYPLAMHVEKAKDCLFEYGMTLSLEFGRGARVGFADTFDFPALVLDEDVALLRKASEDMRPGFPSILRVIVCQRAPLAPPGETFRNRSVGGVLFAPFVVLNSRNRVDDATLLHEMIHASLAGPVNHDKEPNSIFADAPGPGEPDRTWLKPDWATKLSKSFFAQ
jgi:hypothetical protein